MKFLASCLTVVFVSISAGCSSPPKFPTAPPAATKVTVTQSPTDFSTFFPFAKRIGNSDVYLAQFEGGSPVFAILAGPLGAAFSGSLIEAQSKQMSQSFVTASALDVEQKVRSQLKAYPQLDADKDSGATYSVSSGLILQISKDEKMRTSLVVRATNGKTGDSAWEESYFYHFSYMPSRQVFDEKRFDEYLQNLSMELDEASAIAVKVMTDDLTKKSPLGNPMAVRSDFFGNFSMINYAAAELKDYPTYHVFRIDGKPGVIFMPYAQGVHTFKSAAFEKFAER